MKERNQTIDIAKGIAICLMVIGHCYSQENIVRRTIYAFHMPFFFILSGMLYAAKWQRGVNFSTKLICRKFLIPYFVFDTAYCLFIQVLGKGDDALAEFTQTFFQKILPLSGGTVTWYLTCQLAVVCLFVLVLKYIKEPLRIPVIASVFLMALLSVPVEFLWALWRSFIGLGFLAVGFYGKHLFERRIGNRCLVLAGIIFLFLSEKNGFVSLAGLIFGNPLLYVTNSLVGTCLLYQICLRIPQGKWAETMAYFGKNSIVILCTHMFTIECFHILHYKLLNNRLDEQGLVKGLLFAVAAMLIQLPVISVCNRYFYKLFGK